jgi:hypothetical protein
VLIDAELTTVFPDTESVNRALRLLADTAESVASGKEHRKVDTKKRLKRKRLSDPLEGTKYGTYRASRDC